MMTTLSDETDREHGHTNAPGIHWPADPDGYPPPTGWTWVEKCDEGELYDTDEDAARALVKLLGGDAEVAWFDRRTLERAEEAATGQSCAISVVLDRFGRIWNLPPSELCPECNQPDNCGECSHEPLSDDEATKLGAKTL